MRAFLLVLLLIAGAAASQEKKPFTLEELYRGAGPLLALPLPDIQGWADDSSYIEYRRSGPDSGKTVIVDAVSGTVRGLRTTPFEREAVKSLLPKGATMRSAATSDPRRELYVFSREQDLWLLEGAQPSYRRLTTSAAEEKNPTLSPDGARLAYTRENDLYVLTLATGSELRITRDGSESVYNGRAAWLYYEEIFGRPTAYRAFWWSPDGAHLAFFRFDESAVPLFPLYDARGQHGTLERTHYPKAGDPNPEVRFGVADAASGKVTWAAFDEKQDQYFGTPFWMPDGKHVIVQWMNRAQDTLLYYAVRPGVAKPELFVSEHQPQWVEFLETMHFAGNGVILKSDRDGWLHLYHHAPDGALRGQLTSGPWAVEDVQVVDGKRGLIYFTGKKEATTRTDYYRIRFDGSGLQRLTFGPYTHSVRPSPGGSFFVTTYSNLSTPARMVLVDGDGRLVRELGDSRAPVLEEYRMPATELVQIPLSGGLTVPAVLTLPPVVEPGTRYPVLVSTYGGPGAGRVTESWRLSRSGLALAVEGMIQLSVDHRGSGHHGKAGTALMHRNLGKWEMEDYGAAVRWLRAQPSVDSTRVCMTGSSYGGYVAAMALTAGADWFTHGIADLSVTDWRLYDSHYTERYMDTPAENPAGYAAGSVMNHAHKYRGMLRIVHGAMDDNVHMQNALQLVDTLQDLNRHFELMIYPDQRHGIGGTKFQHDQAERWRFYYRHLFRREYPAGIFNRISAPVGMPRVTPAGH
jgi:dipeptidyl-peptidase-4